MTTSTPSHRLPAPVRQAADARREHLLDVTAEMVATGDGEAVSMETVALRAGVSRALVYKHFANRQTLLHALYERESEHLHQRMSAAVQRASTLEDMLGALVTGALAAQSQRAATFAALASHGGRPSSQRNLQRTRDAQTLRHFTRYAVTEIGLDEAVATTALTLALSSIPVVLAQWRRHPTRAHALILADTFVTMTMGGLQALAHQ
jgi:AcrR family transcriptional regulator